MQVAETILAGAGISELLPVLQLFVCFPLAMVASQTLFPKNVEDLYEKHKRDQMISERKSEETEETSTDDVISKTKLSFCEKVFLQNFNIRNWITEMIGDPNLTLAVLIGMYILMAVQYSIRIAVGSVSNTAQSAYGLFDESQSIAWNLWIFLLATLTFVTWNYLFAISRFLHNLEPEINQIRDLAFKRTVWQEQKEFKNDLKGVPDDIRDEIYQRVDEEGKNVRKKDKELLDFYVMHRTECKEFQIYCCAAAIAVAIIFAAILTLGKCGIFSIDTNSDPFGGCTVFLVLAVGLLPAWVATGLTYEECKAFNFNAVEIINPVKLWRSTGIPDDLELKPHEVDRYTNAKFFSKAKQVSFFVTFWVSFATQGDFFITWGVSLCSLMLYYLSMVRKRANNLQNAKLYHYSVVVYTYSMAAMVNLAYVFLPNTHLATFADYTDWRSDKSHNGFDYRLLALTSCFVFGDLMILWLQSRHWRARDKLRYLVWSPVLAGIAGTISAALVVAQYTTFIGTEDGVLKLQGLAAAGIYSALMAFLVFSTVQ